MSAFLDLVHGGVEPFAAIQKFPSVVRLLYRPAEFACPVGGCALRGDHLDDYAHSEDQAPHDRLLEVCAPCCVVYDMADARFQQPNLNELEHPPGESPPGVRPGD